MTFVERVDVGVLPPLEILNGPIAPDFDFTGVRVGLEFFEVIGPTAPDVPVDPAAFAELVVNDKARARMNKANRIKLLFILTLPSKAHKVRDFLRKGSRNRGWLTI